MYVPAVFAETDLATVGTFIDAHPLGTLVLVVDGHAHIDHMPFMRAASIARGEQLIAHVSKSNPTWKLVGDGIEAVLVFSGASAYVSPSLYPSKQVTHEVVPTWNYASVHLRGTLQTVQDRDGKHDIVDRLTRKMESARAVPWSVSDAPEAYIEKLLTGIVGLHFKIDSIEAKVKASQNRLPEDRLGVVAGLSTDPATAEAASMVANRLP
jgi:transcriptional regulator